MNACHSVVKKKTDADSTKIITENTIAIHCENPEFSKGEIINHTYYTLQYSEEDEQAFWVAYKLSPDFLKKNAKRKDKFKEDKKVTTRSSQLIDYKGSGFDRGHLAPAGAMVLNQKAMDETFYMSNMSPQKPSFNRGIWKKLEEQVRKWGRSSDSIFVVTGPILNNIKKSIGPNKVSVPDYYYKVLLKFKNSRSNGIAFLLKNEASKAPLKSFAIPVDSIEKITQINFNPSINSTIEAEIESTFNISDWEFN